MRRPEGVKELALFLVALALLASACGAESGGSPTTTSLATGADRQLGELAAAQERWDAAAPADYTLSQIDRSADTDEPETLAVHEGEVVSLSGEATTVDEVFATIDQSIRDGADVDVDYHPQLGYPVRVAIDRTGDGLPEVHLEYGDLVTMPVVKTVQELRTARRRWEAQGLDSYRYIFRFDCTCPEGGTFEVEVRDGRVIDRRPLDDAARNSSLDPGVDIDSSFDDLEEWFIDSAQLIEEGILAVEVRMDPHLGYPRWFRIEGEDLDGEFFPGRFTMVVTIDLIGELEPVEPDTDVNDLHDLEVAHARWEEAALADYRYTLQVHCMCPAAASGPFRVTVRGGKLESAVLFWDGTETEVDTDVISIGDALEMIGSAIVGGTDVEVVYNAVYGYPQQVVIDPEAVAADGGLAFSITDFEVLGTGV
jgi:hypothetical protein